MKEKIRALLAQAESTDFPEEAEAFYAKAQSLMAEHMISEAEVAGTTTTTRSFGKRNFRVTGGVYSLPRWTILQGVARAYGCTFCRTPEQWNPATGKYDNIVHLFGNEDHLEVVEVLYSSLEQQALRLIPSYVKGVRDRRSWLYGFARGVSDRLAEANRVADEDTNSLLPLLRSDLGQAEDLMRDTFNSLTNAGRSAGVNGSAAAMGERDSAKANIGNRAMPAAQRALGR